MRKEITMYRPGGGSITGEIIVEDWNLTDKRVKAKVGDEVMWDLYCTMNTRKDEVSLHWTIMQLTCRLQNYLCTEVNSDPQD